MAAVNKTAYLLLLATTLLWSGNSIAGRLAVGHVTPMTLVFLRWIVAVLVLLPVGARSVAREWKLVRRHLLLLFALGCCGFTLFNVIFYVALTYTTAINVSIEQAGMPILIIVGNFLFFRVRANWLQIVGIFLTIAGVVLTACHGDPRQLLRLELNFGDAIMLLAVILYSGYSIALRLKPPLHWRSLMLVLGVSALIAAIPFAAWEQASGAAARRSGKREGWRGTGARPEPYCWHKSRNTY